ncbi:hypothetical protein [Methanobacterium spitsbergense]|uniref:Uncharacterized protein n=1 Tax=Methanobacterium spitsbergense TaxID=2874285 RepID=A0A8T5UT95_9EURY|nr:hypothetical protein [Methanobacterium spitsbergense]MBZ2166978.1 hypothetical protein [Methanobacterium spitsbergense]
MDCDNCVYQGHLENSRHSTCQHPEVRHVINDSDLLNQVIVNYKKPTIHLFNGFRIEREQQGIEGNWCLWPFNFDPIWIKECTGFKEVVP